MAENMGGRGGMMGGMGGMMGIAGVVSSVSHALTTLDPRAGAGAIEQVLGLLKGAPGTEAITGTLTSLHGQLAGDSPDGAQVGGLLTTLSQQTRAIGASAGPLAAPLGLLADRLTSVAGQVAKSGTAA